MQNTQMWHMCNLHAYQFLRATFKLFTHVQTTCLLYKQIAYVHVVTMSHVHYLNKYRLYMFHVHTSCMHACCYSATCAFLNMYRLYMFHMHANYMHACCHSTTCVIRTYADYVCCAVILVCFVMIGPRHYTNIVIYI